VPATTSLNKYTLYWDIAPAADGEYGLNVPPFDVLVRRGTLALTATADAADEQRLRAQAAEVAHNLARSLSYENGERFTVLYTGDLVVLPNGQRRLSATAQIINVPALSVTVGEVEIRDAAGNVIDSPALRREREQQAMQQRVAMQALRAGKDANLRDMLDHLGRYVADSEGRLHPLYDVLQVAERLYAGPRESRKKRHQKVASALNLSVTDLDALGNISNDPTVLNGRHPGASQGPHRIASALEVAICERVARAIIENYAAKIVI
jgi:hypothetical protein